MYSALVSYCIVSPPIYYSESIWIRTLKSRHVWCWKWNVLWLFLPTLAVLYKFYYRRFPLSTDRNWRINFRNLVNRRLDTKLFTVCCSSYRHNHFTTWTLTEQWFPRCSSHDNGFSSRHHHASARYPVGCHAWARFECLPAKKFSQVFTDPSV